MRGPVSTAGLGRTDDRCPGDSMEPESATIWADPAKPGSPVSLLVGATPGPPGPARTWSTFGYPLGVTV